eukprot:TRINITY_DN109046_c0_g1_i1.p1 TRINITY_DN109046_c0_g1~~TRINITY_DN109046_c0_g1_i1.p1  ORF type:complete len:318 (+),score=49.54 TRINITY_DN109046_c0_g1_i1:196-1149(+)
MSACLGLDCGTFWVVLTIVLLFVFCCSFALTLGVVVSRRAKLQEKRTENTSHVQEQNVSIQATQQQEEPTKKTSSVEDAGQGEFNTTAPEMPLIEANFDNTNDQAGPTPAEQILACLSEIENDLGSRTAGQALESSFTDDGHMDLQRTQLTNATRSVDDHDEDDVTAANEVSGSLASVAPAEKYSLHPQTSSGYFRTKSVPRTIAELIVEMQGWASRFSPRGKAKSQYNSDIFSTSRTANSTASRIIARPRPQEEREFSPRAQANSQYNTNTVNTSHNAKSTARPVVARPRPRPPEELLAEVGRPRPPSLWSAASKS